MFSSLSDCWFTCREWCFQNIQGIIHCPRSVLSNHFLSHRSLWPGPFDYLLGIPTCNVYLTKSTGTVYPLIANVSVPAGTALGAWGKDAPVYLEEGDYVSSNASATTNLVATTSYEIIS